MYVLDDGDILHIIDMDTQASYEITDVGSIEYDAIEMYLAQSGAACVYRLEESQIEGLPSVMDIRQLEVEDGFTRLQNYTYDDNDNCYSVSCFRGNVYAYRKKKAEERDEKDSIKLKSHYAITERNISITDENVYILYQINRDINRYSGKQSDTYRDGILLLDFDKEKSKIVYETEDNLERIVGFDSEKNIVYLYDVNQNQIQELDLETEQKTEITKLSEKQDNLVFDMTKDKIFIYTDNNKLVQIIEL